MPTIEPGNVVMRSFLELSTAHLFASTRITLDGWCRTVDLNRQEVSSNPLCVAATDHGWWVLVPSEITADLPNDLGACLILAAALGASAVRFDSDGDVADNLPVYEDPTS